MRGRSFSPPWQIKLDVLKHILVGQPIHGLVNRDRFVSERYANSL
jgi:hypothetical protein